MHKKILVGIALLSLAFGCSDHQLRPLSTVQTRLKTITGVDDRNETTYIYDKKNRLESSITRNGFLNNMIQKKDTITYDDKGQIQRIERIQYSYPIGSGEFVSRYYFTYNYNQEGGRMITVKTYQVSSKDAIESLSFTQNFAYDVNNRLLSYSYLTVTSVSSRANYYYTGNNITRVDYFSPQLSIYTYEYDDGINPLNGLYIDNLQDGIVINHSQNNITKVYQNGLPIYSNIYNYNLQRLPTRIDIPYSNSRFVLSYEQY